MSLPAQGALVAVVLALAAPAASSRPGELLPDLKQSLGGVVVIPVVESGETRYRMGYGSGAWNIGAGPLILDGRRLGTSRLMRATQTVRLEGGGTRSYGGAGLLRWEGSGHRHWHFADFQTHELRRASDGKVVATDHKIGFCLTDQHRWAGGPVPGGARKPVFRGSCGKGKTGLERLRVGFSVGWGDSYDPYLEGQYMDITDLPAGRYVLVHRVNPDRRIRESDYSNNVGSDLIRVRWPNGRDRAPEVVVLLFCDTSETCRLPG